jgi:hypothetical protein
LSPAGGSPEPWTVQLTRGVGRRQGLEHPPRDTHEKLRCIQHGDVVGEHGDEDRCRHENHAADERPFRAEALLAQASDNKTDQLTTRRSVAESGLVFGRDSPFALGENAKPLLENRDAEE